MNDANDANSLLYEDLDSCDLGKQVEDLKFENLKLHSFIKQLRLDIQKLYNTITDLKSTNANLTENISSLYKTAKAEIERKNRTIGELREELDKKVLSKGIYGNFNGRRENGVKEHTKPCILNEKKREEEKRNDDLRRTIINKKRKRDELQVTSVTLNKTNPKRTMINLDEYRSRNKSTSPKRRKEIDKKPVEFVCEIKTKKNNIKVNTESLVHRKNGENTSKPINNDKKVKINRDHLIPSKNNEKLKNVADSKVDTVRDQVTKVIKSDKDEKKESKVRKRNSLEKKNVDNRVEYNQLPIVITKTPKNNILSQDKNVTKPNEEKSNTNTTKIGPRTPPSSPVTKKIEKPVIRRTSPRKAQIEPKPSPLKKVATTGIVENSVSLTHDGDIPVLHLEEEYSDLNSNNSIVQLIDDMNMNEIECSIEKPMEKQVNLTVVTPARRKRPRCVMSFK